MKIEHIRLGMDFWHFVRKLVMYNFRWFSLKQCLLCFLYALWFMWYAPITDCLMIVIPFFLPNSHFFGFLSFSIEHVCLSLCLRTKRVDLKRMGMVDHVSRLLLLWLPLSSVHGCPRYLTHLPTLLILYCLVSFVNSARNHSFRFQLLGLATLLSFSYFLALNYFYIVINPGCI